MKHRSSAELPPRGSLGVLASVGEYLASRFPPHTQGVALIVTYACAYAAFARASGAALFTVRAVCGMVSFVLLFLQLRLVDDIDDASSDGAASGLAAGEVRARKRGLIAGLLVTVLGIAALNAGSRALWVALIATAGTTGTTFVLLRWIGRTADRGTWWKDVVLGLFFEGTHFVMILYVYFVGHPGPQQQLPWTTVIPVTGTFFTGFELWKYSRYVTRPSWRPYGLDWRHARIALVAILASSAAFQIATALTVRLPAWYLVYAASMPAFFAVWLFTIRPVEQAGASKARSSLGMLYVGAVNLGIAAASWPPLVVETMASGGSR